MADFVLGIDLGTTFSAVGVVDSGFPILLADEEGRRITPSAVWYGTDGGVETGRKALRRRVLEPDRVVTSVKRLIGRRFAEADPEFPVTVEPSAEGDIRVLGKSPEEVSAEILRELKRIAEWRLGEPVTKAVITVPAYFHDGQRAATKRAGEAAGLEVLRILNEPTAAALAYGLDKLNERSRVAVYDLGGGTFDLSVLEMQDGVFQVLSTHGDTRLGGDDMDMALARWVASRSGVDYDSLDAMARVRLSGEAERVKCVLSESDESAFRAPFFDGDRSLEMTVTRDDFEPVAMPWIERTLRHCRQALADAKLSVEDLQAVVLVGGSTRIPRVRQEVARLFGKEPDVSQHPDEAVALGATIQAGVMSGTLRKMVLLDVTPLSLGVETFGGLMNILISRNTTIPCKAGEMFTNAADGQKSMRVRVLQGEREMARDNWELGCFDVDFEPAPKGRARVGVQFQIDENGILEVLARDVATGRDTVVRIESAAVNVDDAAVEEMVSASVEHAFEDMAERVFTEARLKAEELLPAVEMVLGQGLAEAGERAEIEAAAAAVREALATGAANPLKSAVQRLDLATEALAARMVQDAMEKALEKRLEAEDKPGASIPSQPASERGDEIPPMAELPSQHNKSTPPAEEWSDSDPFQETRVLKLGGLPGGVEVEPPVPKLHVEHVVEIGLKIESRPPSETRAVKGKTLQVTEIGGRSDIKCHRLESEAVSDPSAFPRIAIPFKPREAVAKSRPEKPLHGWDEPPAPSQSRPSRPLRWMWLWGAGILGLIALSYAISHYVATRDADLSLSPYARMSVEVDEYDATKPSAFFDEHPEWVRQRTNATFDAYRKAKTLAQALPFMRKTAKPESELEREWKPWNGEPSGEVTCATNSVGERPFAILCGRRADQSEFTAYFAREGDAMKFDWEATYEAGDFRIEELPGAKRVANALVRAVASGTPYYTLVFPEERYRCFRLASGDGQSYVWGYAERGTHTELRLEELFPEQAILLDREDNKKITLRLSRGPHEAANNQFVITSILHSEWVNP